MERRSAQGEYDPLVGIDHAAICSDFYVETKGEVRQFVQHEYDRQEKLARPVYNTFRSIVKYVHEFDADGEPVADSIRKPAVNSGIVFGLSLLEHTAEALDIPIDDFYEHWEGTSVAVLIDIYGEKYADASGQQKLEALYEGVKTLGLRHLDELPDAYAELSKRAQDGYGELGEYGEPFRAGFGYVIGSGYVAMQYAYERAGMGELDFESFLEQAEQSSGVVPTHQSQADKFVRLIKPNDEDNNAESVIGRVLQDNVDSDEQVYEALQALTLALYREEGDFGMDDTAEAFFMGANLGMHVATDIGVGQLRSSSFAKRWMQTRLHRELSIHGPDYYEHTRINARKAMLKVSKNTSVPSEYDELLEIIKDQQEYDDTESSAFQDGFRYTLMTLLKEVDAQKKGDASRTARHEMTQFDDEFETFMRENDITGSLQEVFNAFIGHCKVFDIDPNNLTEAEAETVLELTLEDYDRLMPEISEIEIHAPCFVQFLNDGDDDSIEAAHLEDGGKIKAEIAGFRLAVAPADDSYIDPSSNEIGQFPLRYVPSYVLKNVRVTLPDGSEAEEESRVMVGFVVPGTKFNRIDF